MGSALPRAAPLTARRDLVGARWEGRFWPNQRLTLQLTLQMDGEFIPRKKGAFSDTGFTGVDQAAG